VKNGSGPAAVIGDEIRSYHFYVFSVMGRCGK
jgi:hypothetical protein